MAYQEKFCRYNYEITFLIITTDKFLDNSLNNYSPLVLSNQKIDECEADEYHR